ncbi:transcriptional regulator, LacI family [Alicyclobacillus acidocaldarius subsp. acidocaldarius DSM 446]|uniref:Catabolite control protein A n=1 Tax=Alicyclobacillus acidocaldarius subsp. acidocaldarius (strain ATCC 27009 / DSM 446 / BCRC 14685 / JCM 5260 / KCTC 1825 / NBRC 15652 / NCIMB 11725 / NRRL B-14509 / 104-IA) TaxID=521098 RepID=C8WRM9_ALIAD|nr:transcriptional regulator, LacI family [Alicyclobacillus acidocaldarius subsp. acidocaldarius DSM 446]
MVTIRDVARKAGVSVSTVSRVINGSGYVGEDTERKVLLAMKELNYQPNRIARGLVSRRTSTIGLLIPDVANPFFSEMARGVEDAAIAEGYSVLLCNSDWKSERELMYIDLLKGRWVDGIVIVGSRSDSRVIEAAVGDTPLVIVDRRSSEFRWSVWTDNRQGAALVVEHLLKMGCSKIVHIAGPSDSPSAQERRKGYEQAISQAGLVAIVYEGDFRFASGFEIATMILEGSQRPDGIFAANDLMAIGVLQAAVKLGVQVPHEVAIVGYDNIPSAGYVSPSLTTVHQPSYQMGVSAFDLLLEQFVTNSGQSARKVKFEPKLVVRDSSLKCPSRNSV